VAGISCHVGDFDDAVQPDRQLPAQRITPVIGGVVQQAGDGTEPVGGALAGAEMVSERVATGASGDSYGDGDASSDARQLIGRDPRGGRVDASQ
jgi:hypothetical protein